MRRTLLAAALAAFASPAAAQRLAADVDCKPARQALVYDCRIALKEAASRKPVAGADVSVGADMPSMPMAHNVKPVKAAPTNQPGEYTARIELEMHGEWALKLNVRSPVRDVIVKKIDFRERP
ncbi:MAG TPA: FixH family protein [Burkholderiales bacterium]|nr:FixH family protein [Burkholderiales bacterium]